jgi:16S rRNA (uracil1498-N3)-methyltransferase
MNLVLFEPHELVTPLIWSDPRAEHVTQILHMGVGDEFAAGIIEGPIGKARITSMHEGMMSLAFEWGETPPPLPPLALIVGLPRPPTARKVLNEVTSLGVGAMHFVLTELGEKNYAQSPLWSSGEWRRHVINGAQQAVDTHLPQVTYAKRLAQAIASLPEGGARVALDNYEASLPLQDVSLQGPVAIAIGPERGWAPRELEALREAGFVLADLGPRVLRVETASVAAVGIVRAKMGW